MELAGCDVARADDSSPGGDNDVIGERSSAGGVVVREHVGYAACVVANPEVGDVREDDDAMMGPGLQGREPIEPESFSGFPVEVRCRRSVLVRYGFVGTVRLWKLQYAINDDLRRRGSECKGVTIPQHNVLYRVLTLVTLFRK